MKLPTIKSDEIDHAKAGAMLRERRLSQGISLRQLASQLDISAPFLSDLELGRRSWTAERFEKAVKILTGLKP
jgi:transcriptional regulator with XRE-family HTH domain